MNCPICNSDMLQQPGNQMHPGDPKFGVTVWCPNQGTEKCPPPEVSGHGGNAKEAYEVVKQKYGQRRIETVD